eukprot:3776785-Amphidinium_carterae.3
MSSSRMFIPIVGVPFLVYRWKYYWLPSYFHFPQLGLQQLCTEFASTFECGRAHLLLWWFLSRAAHIREVAIFLSLGICMSVLTYLVDPCDIRNGPVPTLTTFFTRKHTRWNKYFGFALPLLAYMQRRC